MRKHPPTLQILTSAVLFLCSCSPNPPTSHTEQAGSRQEGSPMPGTSFKLISSAFPDGGQIPRQYTCDDADQSPQLSWSGVPANTRSLALIVEDPDAPSGTWTHWLIWNIPSETIFLPAATPRLRILVSGAQQGYNDFHRIGYAGPCPPPGKPHHYFFKLYALNALLNLKPGATKAALESAIQPCILSQTQTYATYAR